MNKVDTDPDSNETSVSCLDQPVVLMTSSPPSLVSRNEKVQKDLQAYFLLCSSIRMRRRRLVKYRPLNSLTKEERDSIRVRRDRLRKQIRLWKDSRSARVLAMDTPSALAWRMGRLLRANNAWHPSSQITLIQQENLRVMYRVFDALYLQLIKEGYDLPKRLAHYLGDDPVRQLQAVFQACSSWPDRIEFEDEITLTSATYHFSQTEEDILLTLKLFYPTAIRNKDCMGRLHKSKAHVSRGLGELVKRGLIVNVGRERGYTLTENGLGAVRKLLLDKQQ